VPRSHCAEGVAYVGGLPVVAAAIVLICAVEQGDAFARDAAAAGALGLVSLVFFCLAYAACARVAGYVAALIAGWLAFGVATALLSVVNPLSDSGRAALSLRSIWSRTTRLPDRR